MNTQTELDEARRRALLAGGAMFAGSLVGTAGEAVAQDNQPEQIGRLRLSARCR